jgi:hypothetical protein
MGQIAPISRRHAPKADRERPAVGKGGSSAAIKQFQLLILAISVSFDSQKDSPALANLAGLFASCVGPHKGVSG